MKPAIVLVHGSWHVPAIYEPLTSLLRATGFEVTVPQLPSCDVSQAPTMTPPVGDDEAVRAAVMPLLDASREVILLMHSYGGLPGTEAARGLSVRDRKARGLGGGVVHLVYMCAFMLQPDESIVEASKPRDGPYPIAADEAMTSFPDVDLVQFFFADVEPQLARRSADMLVRQSLTTMMNTITYPAWKHIPATYLECTEDQALLLEWQERQVENVKQAGVDIEVRVYESSHSPFLSMTGEMLQVVSDVAGRNGSL